MSFNVYRRNKSLISQSKLKIAKQQKSNKKLYSHGSGDLLLQEAKQIYHSQQNLQEAIRLFEQYLSIHPQHDESLYLCAVAYLHVGKPTQAIQKLLAVSQDYSNKPNALLLASMAYNKIGNFSKSMEIVNECVRKYEQFEEGICFRGKIFMNATQYYKAEADFKMAVALSNASFLSYVGLGDCYRFQGKLQRALNLYFKSLEILSASNVRQQNHKAQIQLKISICLYQLERYQEVIELLLRLAKNDCVKNSQLFYYLGQSQIKTKQKDKGLLNLQYCLRLQTNEKIAKKSYKILLQSYLQDYQFYEALNIIKLGDICNIKDDSWVKTVQAFMLIIKGSYKEGGDQLTAIDDLLKNQEESKKYVKIKKEQSQQKKQQNRYHNKNQDKIKFISIGSPHKMKQKLPSSSQKFQKKISYFSSKSVTKAVPKIESVRLNSLFSIKKPQALRFKTEHSPKQSVGIVKEQNKLFSSKQKQFIYPMILLFKAYAEFFQNNFLRALDTYDEYQNYIKDVYGRDSDILYNKSLCQALLMAESDLHDEALVKYSSCVDIYYQKYGIIPPQPLLYKIIHLAKLALSKLDEEDNDDVSAQQILQSTLQLIENYKPAIGKHHLAYYYKGLIELLLEKEEESRQSFEKTLKFSEECSWKYLYVKGVNEMMLGNYYDAIKEFSAGLILQNRPQFYLGRSISFLMMAEKDDDKDCNVSNIKNIIKSVNLASQLKQQNSQKEIIQTNSEVLIQNCFEDLQKYIELSSNQQQISVWVSKILFYNKAYDEAIRSLTKIHNQSKQIILMMQCIQIYEGEFYSGGQVGEIIKNAFEGQFLSLDEEEQVINTKIIKNYNHESFGFLTSDYQKWLVILHLYSKQNYSLLLKYLQRQLFNCSDELTQIFLRYNVAQIYYLMNESTKAINVIKGLSKYDGKYDLKSRIKKFQNYEFEEDECLTDLKEEIGINNNKLLSSYLPYKQALITNQQGKRIKIYLKISIPFPQFPNPSMQMKISHSFIKDELNIKLIEKKIEAPWIKKIKNNKAIQFTQKLDESIADDERSLDKAHENDANNKYLTEVDS